MASDRLPNVLAPHYSGTCALKSTVGGLLHDARWIRNPMLTVSQVRHRIDGGIVAPFEGGSSKGAHMSAKRLLVAGVLIGIAEIVGHASAEIPTPASSASGVYRK